MCSSGAGVAREALQLAGKKGLQVRLMVPRLLYPVAEEAFRDFFAGMKAGLVVEQAWEGMRDRPLTRTSSEMLLLARKE